MPDNVNPPKPAKQAQEKPAADPATAKADKPATSESIVKTSAAGKKKKSAATKPEKALKHAKRRQQKMVRDSFAMPADDYSKLDMLKAKCLENGIEIKKSELLRAGLIALSKMSTASLAKVVGEVERIKTGRPKAH